MKRSSSLSSSKTPKDYRRAFTWNEKTNNDQVKGILARASALPTFVEKDDEWNVLSPISRSGQKVNSKIFTSDFWSNAMRVKLRKIKENNFVSGKSLKIPLQGCKFDLPSIGERFKRSKTEKVFATVAVKEVSSKKRKEKKGFNEKIPTVKSLELIIDECNSEVKDSRKLNHDMKMRRKVIEKDFESVKKIIRLD